MLAEMSGAAEARGSTLRFEAPGSQPDNGVCEVRVNVAAGGLISMSLAAGYVNMLIIT